MRSKSAIRRARAGVILVVAVIAQFVPAVQGAQAAGVFGLSFNGAGQYVTFGRAPGLGADTFTVETWFRKTGPGRTTTTSGLTGGGLTAAIPLVAKGRAEADGTAVDLNYFLGLQNGVLAGDYEEGATGIKPGLNHAILGATPIADGLWYHAALTFDGGVLRLYLNGVLDAEVIVGAGRPPRSDSIQHASLATAMNSTGVTGGGFDGQLDEARIWNVSRTAPQIAGSMDAEITVPAAGLLARWGMNEGAGNVVGDSAGSAINGTAVGAPPWGGGFQSVEPPIVVPNAPADALTGVGNSTTLRVTATDPQGLPMNVQFFGRPFASGMFSRIGGTSGVPSGAQTSIAWTGLLPGQTYEWYATADDGSTVGPSATRTFSTTPGPDPVLIGAGDIAQCGASLAGAQATAQILAGVAGTVFTAGDDAYPDGAPADFANCYDPTWGAAKARTRPAPGNHEWRQPGLSGYFGYFGAGVAANPSGASYYSYDLGPNWHAVVLDSECAKVGGCGVGSPQLTWLRADLQANAGRNVVAIWHKPRFGSGRTALVDVQPFWDVLYEFKADLVINGHDHIYERLAPIDATGAADPVRGIRQFTVGTGGSEHHVIAAVVPVSEARDVTTFGVLKVVLHANSYDWTYMPVAGGTYTDSGTSPVNGAPNAPPIVTSVSLAPAAPLTADVVTATTVASDPDGSPVTLSYRWQRNGVTIPGETGSSLNLVQTGNGDRGDAITATATASDGSVQSQPYTSDPVLVGNSAPVAGGAIDDPTPVTDEVITAAVTGNDPDGDPVSLAYRWRVNGVIVPGEIARTFDLGKTGNGNRGDKIAVNVTPSDGILKGAVVTYRATIVNALPVVGPVLVTPAPPGTNDLLTATASAADADGDAVTLRYQWRRNGVDIGGATARTLDLSLPGNGDAGDVITVAVSGNDGTGTGSPRISDPLTVTGSAIPTVQPVTTSTGHRSSGVTIPLLGTDPQGRALTYAVVTAPLYGTITITGANARYVPTGDVVGTDTFTYRASNGTSVSASASGTVTLTNAAPGASVTLDDPTPGTNAVLSANASGTDADGDAVSLTYEWRVNGVLIAGETGASLDLSKAGNGNKGDTVSVSVTPFDGHVNGAAAGAQAVVRNGGPSVNSITITPVSPNTGDILTANVGATDPDGDALTYGYQWRLNGVNILGQAGATLDLSLPGNGDRGDQVSVVVTATDGTATSAPATSAATQVGNRAPTAAPVTASVSHRAAGGVDIALLGSDPDGDGLTYSVVDQPSGGTVSISGTTAHYTPTGEALGTDAFTYRASDGLLTSAPATGTVTRTNAAPGASVTLDDPTPGTNAVLSANALGTDADGDAVSLTYEWRVNGVLIAGETGASLDLSKAGNGNKGDTVSVSVTPFDGHVNGAAAGAQAVVRNGGPSVNSITAGPASPGTNATVNAAASATDPDADPLTLSYQWRRNGTDIPGQTAATLDLSLPGNGDRGDQITVVVTASDGLLTSAPSVAEPIFVGNAAPTVAAVSASVGHRSGAGVDIPLLGGDPDGDGLTFSVVTGPAAGTLTINGATAHYIPTGDTVGTDTFTYRANDGLLFSAPAQGTIALTNAVPSDSVMLDTASPTTNTTVQALTSGSDPDGDAVTYSYQWRVNGVLIAGETGASLDLSKAGNGNKGDVVAVMVIPSDGHVNGAAASAQATVANSAPTVGSVTIAPASPRTSDVLSSTVAASDADGDALTYIYRWQRNGIDIPGATGAGLDLGQPGNGDRGDQVTVVVTASDASASSAPLTSAPTTVANTAPTASAVTATVGHRANGVDIPLLGADADSDALTFSIVTAPARGTVTITGSTARYVPSGDVPGSDTFTYRSSDGTLTSTPATGSLTLTNAAPTASVTLDDPTPPTNALLRATPVGADGDGDTVSFTYQWRVNGVLIAGETGASLDLSKVGNGSKGDTVAVSVTPFDGHVNGAIAGAQSVVRNGAPTITSVTLSPSAPKTNDTISATPSATDPDGDPITYAYQWRLNGMNIAGQTGASLNLALAGNGNRGDQVSVTVTANDATTSSTPFTSASTTVTNTAPTATASFDLASPPGNAIATGRATSADIDGDTVSFVYVWKVNGVVRRTSPSTTALSDTFDLSVAGNGNAGDVLSLEITPNDGTTDGAFGRVQATVVADNLAPTAQNRSVIVAPGTPRSIGLIANDPEGGALTYEIVAGPIHGTLSGSGSTRTYTPNAGYGGPDSFTFRVRDALQPSNVATVSIEVSQTFGVNVSNAGYSPNSITIGQGDRVLWSFTGNKDQSVTDVNALALLNSGLLRGPSTYQVTFIGAGTYRYQTTGHGGSNASVSVPLVISPASGLRTDPFLVTWAAEDAPSTFLFDVEYQRPGSSTWLSWKTGVRTVSGSFTPDAGMGTYSFRARLRNASNGAFSDWSGTATLSAT